MYRAIMFGLVTSADLRQLRDAFGKLEARLAQLETRAPALSASYLEAADKLQRAAARLDKSTARAREREEEERPLETLSGSEIRALMARER